jgi:hypothetical protein
VAPGLQDVENPFCMDADYAISGRSARLPLRKCAKGFIKMTPRKWLGEIMGERMLEDSQQKKRLLDFRDNSFNMYRIEKSSLAGRRDHIKPKKRDKGQERNVEAKLKLSLILYDFEDFIFNHNRRICRLSVIKRQSKSNISFGSDMSFGLFCKS